MLRNKISKDGILGLGAAGVGGGGGKGANICGFLEQSNIARPELSKPDKSEWAAKVFLFICFMSAPDFPAYVMLQCQM
jgi:hypothetical protein